MEVALKIPIIKPLLMSRFKDKEKDCLEESLHEILGIISARKNSPDSEFPLEICNC